MIQDLTTVAGYRPAPPLRAPREPTHDRAVHWLSGTDSLFVSLERPPWSQTIAVILPIDATAPAFGGFPAIRRIVARRLAAIPRFRWRIKQTPLGLGRPVWVKDAAFDLDHHVRRCTVPAPGGRREVGELVGDLLNQPLDRRLPLWEVVYLDGLANGTVVVVAKFHHSMTDGRGLANVVQSLLDDAPTATADPLISDEPDPKEPSSLDLLSRGVVSTLTSGVRVLRYARGLAERTPAFVTGIQDPETAPLAAPRSAFNGAVGQRRVLAFSSVTLADVLKAKAAFGVTVNDLAVATVAGAVRDYLRAIDQLPDHPLVASVPMSTADAEAVDSWNDVVNMWVSLPTNEASPVERVRLTHRATAAAKSFTEAVRRTPLESVGTVLPPWLLQGAVHLIEATHAGALGPAFGGNLVVSNVRGPDAPRYVGGARVLAAYPASIVTINLGLNITLMSYDDRVDLGITVDPDIVRDPWLLADRVQPALAELMDAAGLGAPSPIRDPFTINPE